MEKSFRQKSTPMSNGFQTKSLNNLHCSTSEKQKKPGGGGKGTVPIYKKKKDRGTQESYLKKKQQ